MEQEEFEEEQEDEDGPRTPSPDGEQDGEQDIDEWTNDNDFPFEAPAGLPESTALPPTSDDEPFSDGELKKLVSNVSFFSIDY